MVVSPLEKFNIQHKWPCCQKQIDRDMSWQYRRRFSTKYSLDDTVLTFKTLLMLIEILLTNTFFLPRCPCCLMSIPEAPAGILGYISKLIENILIVKSCTMLFSKKLRTKKRRKKSSGAGGCKSLLTHWRVSLRNHLCRSLDTIYAPLKMERKYGKPTGRKKERRKKVRVQEMTKL